MPPGGSPFGGELVDMCQVMDILSLYVTACPKGGQARRMVAHLHPMRDTLAAPCRLGSREALELGFLSLSKFTHILYGSRYAGLAFVRGVDHAGFKCRVLP